MCTPYYRQVQVDNSELRDQLELLAAQSPNQDQARLRQLNAELQMRVAQLEAENASITQVFSRSSEPRRSELPAVRGTKDQTLNFRLSSPMKKETRLAELTRRPKA